MDESDASGSNDHLEVAEEEQLDPNNPEHAFALNERQYNKTLTELEQNPDLVQFADDFSKIFEAYYTSHEREQQLQQKCQEFEENVSSLENLLEVSKALAKTDVRTIEDLEGQITHAWKMADNAHAREQTAQEIIDNLRKQIDSLNAEIEFKNRMGQDEEMGALSKHKEGLQRERDKLASEVTKLTEKLNNALSYQDELERRTSQADVKINEVTERLEDQTSEVERQKKIKDKLDYEIKELNEAVEKKDFEISNLNENISMANKNIAKVEASLREQKIMTDKAARDSEVIHIRFAKMQDDLDSAVFNHERLKKDYMKRANEIRFKEEEVVRYKNEVQKCSKSKEILENRIKQLEEEKSEIVMEREKLRQEIANMSREIDIMKRTNDSDKRGLEQVTREKDILNKNMIRQQAVTRDQVKLIKIQEQARRKLIGEIDTHVIESNKKNKQISYLEKERDRFVEEQLNLTKKIEDSMDEAKLKKGDAEIYDLKKSLAERDNKLRMQLNLFEAVRADRNALEKALLESNAECGELKTKLKVSSHQTEQLKEDISMKEQLLIKEEIILRKVTKEKENLRVEVDNCMETVRNLKTELGEMKAEEKRLHKVILKGDRLIRQQTKDLEQLMNERDILGSQLVRRNDELALLYEKIKILQTTLHRGEAQYGQRLEDIRLLKVEIKRLRQEKNLLTKQISNMTDLRQEVFHLERDLTRERLKSKALEEELQNPLNIHRWRKLEGTDPDTFELLQKVQLLQKRILRQSSQALERERQLKEAERLYLNLRQVVARQPGPEVHNQLKSTQRALTVNINKMKCLVSELNMTELQVKEYKSNLEKVTDELIEMKKKQAMERKMHVRRLTALRDTNENKTSQSRLGEIKFSGGGFRMSVNN